MARLLISLVPISSRSMAETASARCRLGSDMISRRGARAFQTARPVRSATQPSSRPETLPVQPLSWPEYFSLRTQQRRYALFSTIPTTTLGLGLGINYFATIEAAPTDLIMGIEAPYVYGIATLACGMLGYLIGPSIGHALFKLRVSKPSLAAMQLRNSQFYSHIKHNRVDPAQSIVNNPLPDWHGERVGSLRDYRRWLRDQSAYRRKATQHGMLLRPEDINKGKELL